MRLLWLLLPVLLLAGCASYSGGNELIPGTSATGHVEAVMGPPTLVQPAADGGKILWYPRQPYGRESFAVRVDSSETLVSIEQRLTPDSLARIQKGKTTEDDVLALLGPPFRIYQFSRKEREAWYYPMRKSVDWYDLTVEFSPDKVVRDVIEIYVDRSSNRTPR